MSDTSKPDSPVTANPPPASPSLTRFPGADGGSTLEVPASDRGDDIVYQPLSAFTIAAFGVAAVYSAIVVIGAIVAAVLRMPLLMGGWTAVFPVVAIVLALIGWMQVQASEGTRTGRQLAIWAITLSVVVSLGYWAYYTATYFVVRRDAQAFCQQFFEKVKEGKLESAFIMTVAPKQRPREDAGLRDAIENRFNHDPGQNRPGGGYFNIFKDHLFVHVVRQGGADAVIQPLGVTSWEFAGGGGGYVVRERYRVTTPEMSYEGLVIIKSTEPQGKDLKARQWHIALNEMPANMAGITPIGEGSKLLPLQRSSGTYLAEWRGRLMSNQQSEHVECFLGTLDPVKRKAAADAYRKSLPEAAALMVGTGGGEAWCSFAYQCAAALAAEEHLPGYAAFARGELVRLDPTFWAGDDELREKALPACRAVFHNTLDLPLGMLQTDLNRIAYWSRGDGRVRFQHTAQFQLRTLEPTVEAQIVVECPESVLELGPTPDCWRIVAINLTSVRPLTKTSQSGQGRQFGPGGIGGFGPGP
jgi:hypothetical protein